MISKTLKFISPFLSSHLNKDPVSIHNAVKGMSYSQAAIAFAVFIQDTSNQSPFMAAFTFIFPIFIALGAAFGMLSQQKNRNGELLSVAIFLFLVATALHAISLFIFFFRINSAAAFTFMLSIIAIFNLAGFVAKLYGNISKQNQAE